MPQKLFRDLPRNGVRVALVVTAHPFNYNWVILRDIQMISLHILPDFSVTTLHLILHQRLNPRYALVRLSETN